ncbi:MAG: VRR-NUC domain-containing protein [Candidatus Marinimicrobia bacterium]|nr:VRR-NUC domain-containing protein [Candidatus Neomarinimicrobiota bacterium]
MGLNFTPEELEKLMRENPDFAAVNRLPTSGGKSPAVILATAPMTNESEASFQKRLIEELNRAGWLVCEYRKARIRKGGVDTYRTPFGAQGVGFPDLYALRPPRQLFIENKSTTGSASKEQIKWLVALAKCPGNEVYCWSPTDWEKILEIIK